MNAVYDPAARFEIDVHEEQYRRGPTGRALMARLYRPQGRGPFPVLLDLHGGAWNTKDRLANETMDRVIAASGVLVAAIDEGASTSGSTSPDRPPTAPTTR